MFLLLCSGVGGGIVGPLLASWLCAIGCTFNVDVDAHDLFSDVESDNCTELCTELQEEKCTFMVDKDCRSECELLDNARLIDWVCYENLSEVCNEILTCIRQ